MPIAMPLGQERHCFMERPSYHPLAKFEFSRYYQRTLTDMNRHSNQPLGEGKNPIHYMELIDTPKSLGYQIRKQVIFPTLFKLIEETIDGSETPLIDVGSGTGSLTDELRTHVGGFVSGTDISPGFITLSKKNHPTIPFYQMESQVPVGLSMHHVNSHLVLHCVKEVEKHVEQLIDITEPNGYLCITVPHPDYFKASTISPDKEHEVCNVTIEGTAQLTYYRRSLSWYENLFKRLGVTIVKQQGCLASPNAPQHLDYYKTNPSFVVYVLQKKLYSIDTALVTQAGTGKTLLLKRAPHLEEFPGTESLFSRRQATPGIKRIDNLVQGMHERVGITPDYVSPYKLASITVKHKHKNYTRHARVHLWAVQISNQQPKVQPQFYTHAQFISPINLKPEGGACTFLAHEYIQSRR